MRKLAMAGILMLIATATCGAFETKYNPDQMASVGVDVIKMQQGGMFRSGINGATTDSQGVGFRADYRVPITNAFTFHAAAETTTIDNNLQYTDGYRIEIGGRVYFGNH